jgi:hypothetical protein
VKSRRIRIILVAVLALSCSVALAACSSASAGNSSTTPTIGNINCQTHPNECIPVVTATTVPATYSCAGGHSLDPDQGELRVTAFGRNAYSGNCGTALGILASEMMVQVGKCLTSFAVHPNRVSVYFSPNVSPASVGLVAQWLEAQSKVISHVEVQS